MNNNLTRCQCVCFLIGKKLGLSFNDIRQMAEDLNNLRGSEWQGIIDRLNDTSLSVKWSRWSQDGVPDSPTI